LSFRQQPFCCTPGLRLRFTVVARQSQLIRRTKTQDGSRFQD
jgi:hypothetical protein